MLGAEPLLDAVRLGHAQVNVTLRHLQDKCGAGLGAYAGFRQGDRKQEGARAAAATCASR